MRVEDAGGYDVLEGVGANRDNAHTEHAAIVYASTSVHPVIHESDSLTLVIDNHFAPSAQISIEFYYCLGA